MTRAVFLDVLGTLLALEPPWVSIRAQVPSSISDERLERALRAEMAYYREHAHEGRDKASLAELRERCASIVSSELSHEVTVDQLVESIRFGPLSRRRARSASAPGARIAAGGRLELGLLPPACSRAGRP